MGWLWNLSFSKGSAPRPRPDTNIFWALAVCDLCYAINFFQQHIIATRASANNFILVLLSLVI